MSVSAVAPVSVVEGAICNNGEFPVLATVGEYTIYPMQICSEEQIAKLFVKICQRGNPVLQGRPAADLILLGKAMYRKSMVLGLSQVAVHNGQPVAVGFSWDAAEGGVWKDCGLDMPASMAAHAACGKAAFDSLPRNESVFFGAFFGVLPPHNVKLFGILAVSSFIMGNELGFKDGFQFTLLPTLDKRGGSVFAKYGKEEENANWNVSFDEIAAKNEGAVSDELLELNGNLNISLSTMEFMMGDEWMGRAATTVRLESAQAIREPSTKSAMTQLNWLKTRSQSANMIPSRL